MTKSRGILTRKAWTEADDAAVRERYPHERTAAIALDLGRKLEHVYTRAAALGLKKSDAFFASELSGRVLPGNQGERARAGHFLRGNKSWNKGLKGVTGLHENTRRTQFKKGEMAGAAQHNYVPIGTEPINADGYLDRKVTDDPTLVPARRWVSVHRLVWEAANGPVPAGHVVVFRRGRRTTERERITLEAVELVSRGELMRRNSYHTNYPKELAQLVQLKAALKRKINRRSQA